MQIGTQQLTAPVILAPMSGITDYPFRQVARKYGVGMTVSEMVASSERLRDSQKSQLRRISQNEVGVTSVQLLGNAPRVMAAAQYNVDCGAKLIDINMGCQAKKVLKKAAGSTLLADEVLVDAILTAVVSAVDVPVTLKIRTGTDKLNKNALHIANIAQNAGIQSLAIHGRTRACKFEGEAEYDTIKLIKQRGNIPVVANGDIVTVAKAVSVKNQTQADAVMVGRGAQGKPWLLGDIVDALSSSSAEATARSTPSIQQQMDVCLWHLEMIYQHYGAHMGVRIARKHIRWYLLDLVEHDLNLKLELKRVNSLSVPNQVLKHVATLYSSVMNTQPLAA